MKYNLNSDFYCTKCGKKGIKIIRQEGRNRKAGHLKKIYCLNCKEEVNHVEVKPFSQYDYKDFLFEFEYKNFSPKGERILSYGLFRDKMYKEGVELP